MRRFLIAALSGLAACSRTERGAAGFADVNGTRLYYERQGQGQTVVLIEGANMGLGQWDEQFAALSKQFDVIRYDVRGFGRSGRADVAPYTMHDDLHALLGRLGVAH